MNRESSPYLCLNRDTVGSEDGDGKIANEEILPVAIPQAQSRSLSPKRNELDLDGSDDFRKDSKGPSIGPGKRVA